jgi:hypothetical protein
MKLNKKSKLILSHGYQSLPAADGWNEVGRPSVVVVAGHSHHSSS